MPLDESVIALRAVPQSTFQMLLYYIGCRVEAAVRHLISLPADRWPDGWFERLLTENMSDWSISLQGYYATRLTSPLPVPAPQAALLEHTTDAENLKRVLLGMDPCALGMADRIRRFLPDWNKSKRDEFEGAWWLGGELKPDEELSREYSTGVFLWAQRYFQNLWWQETPSPIDEMHHNNLDAKEVSLLKMLQKYIGEVSSSEKQMEHCARRVAQLRRMLERRVREREHEEDIYEKIYAEV